MRVLIAHNFYQQPGGEDQVFRSELALLESRGHRPVAFEMHNDDVRGMGKIALTGATMATGECCPWVERPGQQGPSGQ